MTPGICQVCYEPHAPVVKEAQAVARCGCGGRVVFPNREREKGCLAKGAKSAKSAKGFNHQDSKTPRERPLLFSGEMVRAILDGRKTQTRRTVKPQPPCECDYVINGANSHALCFKTGTSGAETIWVPPTPNSIDHRLPCPYGQAGDRLWVKETHLRYGKWVRNGLTKKGKTAWRFKTLNREVRFPEEPGFTADVLPTIKRGEIAWHKRPSIFMPRWASRITLEVTGVRVERLHEISFDDCRAEGIEKTASMADLGTFVYRDYRLGEKHDPFEWYASPRDSYKSLWESINGAESWASNPWVWVVTFKRIEFNHQDTKAPR